MAGQYPDVPYIGPPRSYNATSYAKRYVVIHNTSNSASARGEAGWAMRRTDGTSSHYYGDRLELIQSLSTVYGANHVGSSMGNRYGISYEITGFNHWTRAQWMASVNWSLISRQIARDMVRHRIPAQFLTIAQMRQGTPGGMVTHDQCRQAWGGTDHTDPGPNFPMDYLLSLVKAQLNGGGDAVSELTDIVYPIMNGSDAGGYEPGKLPNGEINPVAAYNLRILHGMIDKLATGMAELLARPSVDPAKLAIALAPYVTKVVEDALAGGGVPSAADIEAACRRGVTGLSLH